MLYRQYPESLEKVIPWHLQLIKCAFSNVWFTFGTAVMLLLAELLLRCRRQRLLRGPFTSGVGLAELPPPPAAAPSPR